MRKLVIDAGLGEQIAVASAGTAAYHTGEPADVRSRQEALSRGVRLESRARQFQQRDFEHFEYVLAMDAENLDELRNLTEDPDHLERLDLLRNFDPGNPSNRDVPDPYYGDEDGFGRVYDICESACRGLLQHISQEHGLA